MLLSSGEDARTGPGARSIAVVLGLVECARDMRPLGEDAEGDGGQDGPRGDARRPPRTSAVVFAFTDMGRNACRRALPAAQAHEMCHRFDPSAVRPWVRALSRWTLASIWGTNYGSFTHLRGRASPCSPRTFLRMHRSRPSWNVQEYHWHTLRGLVVLLTVSYQAAACRPADTSTISEPVVLDPDWQLGDGPRYVGDEAFDQASYSITVGKIDADGTRGILVGTPHNAEDYSSPPPGPYPWHDGAFLLKAPFEGGVIPDVAAATFEGYTDGVARGVGGSVGLVGDVTGDGQPDVAVAGAFPDRHLLAVFSGPHNGSRAHGEADATFWYDAVGGVAATVPCGDINADGVDDLLLNGGSAERSGALVLFGPLVGDHLFDDEWDILVGAPTEGAGEPLAAWDQNGDGSKDLVMGATDYDSARGRVYLIEVPASGSFDLHDADAIWEGEAEGGHAGMSLASGDLNGDGGADLFIGAPLLNDRTGRAYVALDATGGALEDAPLTFEPQHDGDWMGYSAAIADYDGDGQDDLAVGAPRDIYSGFDRPGRVIVFRGPLAPGNYTEDLADAIWMGSDVPDSFGARLLADDLDADGRADLVVGAPWDQETGVDAGAVTILFAAGL